MVIIVTGSGNVIEAINSETNAERIVRVLLMNSGRAYRPREIAEETGINTDSVRAVLTRLRSRGIVEHDTPYWAVGDAEKAIDEFLIP